MVLKNELCRRQGPWQDEVEHVCRQALVQLASPTTRGQCEATEGKPRERILNHAPEFNKTSVIYP